MYVFKHICIFTEVIIEYKGRYFKEYNEEKLNERNESVAQLLLLKIQVSKNEKKKMYMYIFYGSMSECSSKKVSYINQRKYPSTFQHHTHHLTSNSHYKQ